MKFHDKYSPIKKKVITFMIIKFENDEAACDAVFEEREANLIKGLPVRTAFVLPKTQEFLRENRNANISIHQTQVDATVDNRVLKNWLRANSTSTVMSAAVKSEKLTGKKIAYIMFFDESEADTMQDKFLSNVSSLESTLGIQGAKVTRAHEDIFVSGIDKEMTEQEFMNKFATFGPLYNACLRKDPSAARPSVGFVQFLENGSAQAAIKALNGTTDGNTAYQIVIYKPPEDVSYEHRTTHQAKIAKWKKTSTFVKDLP